jgi:hypothetical protein
MNRLPWILSDPKKKKNSKIPIAVLTPAQDLDPTGNNLHVQIFRSLEFLDLLEIYTPMSCGIALFVELVHYGLFGFALERESRAVHLF